MNRPTEIWFGQHHREASRAIVLLAPSPNFAERYVYLGNDKSGRYKSYRTSRRLSLDRRYREIP